jgi:hypothetical protein
MFDPPRRRRSDVTLRLPCNLDSLGRAHAGRRSCARKRSQEITSPRSA